jgi:hypothetical protein
VNFVIVSANCDADTSNIKQQNYRLYLVCQHVKVIIGVSCLTQVALVLHMLVIILHEKIKENYDLWLKHALWADV